MVKKVSYHIKDSKAYTVFKVFNTIIMILTCIATLYPFLYLVAQSFSSEAAIVQGEIGILPVDFNIDTYVSIINDGKFIGYYGNTILYSIIAYCMCSVLLSTVSIATFKARTSCK